MLLILSLPQWGGTNPRLLVYRREVEEAFKSSVESVIVRISSVAARGGAQVSWTSLLSRSYIGAGN